jgi:integrase
VQYFRCAENYIADHRSGWRGPRVEYQWRQSLADHAKPLATMAVEDITREPVHAVLRPIWSAIPETASRTRSRIELILDYATALGWRSGPNPAMWRGGLKALLPTPGKLHATVHYAALDWREAPALMAALAANETMSALCLRFVVLTACRSREARMATWDEIELAQRLWTLPAARTKQGRMHAVPLAEPILELLRGLYAMRQSALVFPGRGGAQPIADAMMPHTLHRTGFDGCTVHGMRSTFAQWAQDHGHPPDLIEASLAHAVGNVVARSYQRSDVLDLRRGLMDQWAQFLTRAPAAVVPIRAAG